MSTVYYNGILLTRCNVLECTARHNYHGTDYVNTTHRLRVRAQYNPEINAYSFAPFLPSAAAPNAPLAGMAVALAGAPSRDFGVLAALSAAGLQAGLVAAAAGQARGAVAPVTKLALEHVLAQPRKLLVWGVGPTPTLVSPGINADGSAAATDAKCGPFPVVHDVVQLSGTKTMLVDVGWETTVNYADRFVATPSVLLAHRWRRWEDIDQDMYSTLVTEGVAVFRSDRLLFLGGVADEFRGHLVQPVNPGFRRTGWHFEPSEDGTELRYWLKDVHTHTRIAPRNVTRVECFHRVNTHDPSLEVAAAKAVLGGVRGGLTAGLLGLIEGLVPLTRVTVLARVWGNDATNRKALERVAINLIQRRLVFSAAGLPAIVRALAGTSMDLLHDCCGTFVEATAELATVGAPVVITFTEGPLAGAAMPGVNLFFPAFDGTPPVLFADDLLPQNDLPGGRNVAGTGTRLGFVRQLAAAALLGQNVVPAGPPALPPVALARTPP